MKYIQHGDGPEFVVISPRVKNNAKKKAGSLLDVVWFLASVSFFTVLFWWAIIGIVDAICYG